MKQFKFLLVILVSLLIISSSPVEAQDELPPDAPNKQQERQNRPNLFAELGLSPQQRQQIRRVNVENRPFVRAAQRRLHEANRSLDQAIYADNPNEAEIAARLKEVQTAQSELIKLRFSNELAVRKILSVEQIAKFRALREQFERKMENSPNQNPRRMEKLKQRLKLRRNQMRPNN